MNWFHREEHRYVEYGSSFRAAQRFGIARQLTDTVYNMNRAHLSQRRRRCSSRSTTPTCAPPGTTYLMYRGRHRHEPQRDTALTRVASTLMRHPVMGPRELFYADIFASRRTGCRSGLGMPGVRDRHSGCVSAYLVEHDLFDFLLLSLPDNDWYSHKRGPEAQLQSLAQADLQLARVCERRRRRRRVPRRARGDRDGRPLPGAGHGHDRAAGRARRARRARARRAAAGARGRRRAARSPCARPSARRWSTRCTSPSATRCAPRSSPRALAIDGVDLVDVARARRARAPARGGASRAPSTASCASRPGGPRRATRAAARWSVDGALAVIGGERRGRRAAEPRLPRRARARVVGADLPDLRRGAAVGGARLRVRRLGRARRTSAAAATARCTRATRSARSSLCGVALPEPEPGAVGDPRRRRRSCSGTSGSCRVDAAAPPGRLRHAPPASVRSAMQAPPLRARRAWPAPLATARACGAAGAALARPAAAAERAGSAPQPSQRRRAQLGSLRASARVAAPSAATSTAQLRRADPGAPSDTPPAGRRLSPNQVLAIAERAAEDARRARRNTRAPTAART